MYHVTTANNIESIQTNGVRSRGIPTYYSERYELDKAADTIGAQLYSHWVSRVHGVYFWETKTQAIRETQHDHYDRIVEVDPNHVSGPIWKLSSDVWETVYQQIERPHNITPDDDIWNTLETIVEQAKRDDGARTGDHEVWTRSPVSPSAIVDTYALR